MKLTRKDKINQKTRYKYMIDRSNEIEKNWDDKDLAKQVLKIKEFNITEISFKIDPGDMLGSRRKELSSKDELLRILDQTPTSEIVDIYLRGEYKGIRLVVLIASGLILFSESSQYNEEIAALVEKV